MINNFCEATCNFATFWDSAWQVSIGPVFRGPRFKSRLNLNVFFHHHSTLQKKKKHLSLYFELFIVIYIEYLYRFLCSYCSCTVLSNKCPVNVVTISVLTAHYLNFARLKIIRLSCSTHCHVFHYNNSSCCSITILLFGECQNYLHIKQMVVSEILENK